MMGKTHREWGAVSGALISAVAGNDPLNVLTCAFVGYHVASLPDRIEHWPLSPFRAHRGMSHAWELWLPFVLLAWWLPWGADYLVWGFALGVFSHLSGDFLFGKAGRGRGAGIPLFLGRYHIGFGILKVNGWTEDAVYVFLHELRYGFIAAAVVLSVFRMTGTI